MKKYLIALAFTAAIITTTADAARQQHRHTPRTTVTSTVSTQNDADRKDATADTAERTDNGIEAYSDTTSAALDSTDAWQHYSYSYQMDEDGLNNMMNGLSWIGSGMLGTAIILLILFVIAPVSILLVLLYFIYKTRKQKLQLAEMAIKNGQPVPDVLGTGKSSAAPADDLLWRNGIKNVFLGIGLMFFFGCMSLKTGIGIGFLVLFYGAGQAVIARTSAKRQDDRPNDDYGRTGDRRRNQDIEDERC